MVTKVFIFSSCIRVRKKSLSFVFAEESTLELAALSSLGASVRIESKIWLDKVGNYLPMSNLVFVQISVNIKFAMHGHAVRFGSCLQSLLQHDNLCRHSYAANIKRNRRKERYQENASEDSRKRKRQTETGAVI